MEIRLTQAQAFNLYHQLGDWMIAKGHGEFVFDAATLDKAVPKENLLYTVPDEIPEEELQTIASMLNDTIHRKLKGDHLDNVALEITNYMARYINMYRLYPSDLATISHRLTKVIQQAFPSLGRSVTYRIARRMREDGSGSYDEHVYLIFRS